MNNDVITNEDGAEEVVLDENGNPILKKADEEAIEGMDAEEAPAPEAEVAAE